MAESPCLVIATTNRHKLEELREIYADLPYVLVDLDDLGVTLEVEETGDTFQENAVLKALACAEATGMLSLADDSGLEIDALGGEPGVYSARWSGVNTPYPERFRLINNRLGELGDEQRAARYRCAIAIAEPAPRGLYDVSFGVFEGRIAREPRGTAGFGYDPIFYVPERAKTVGEMSAEEKHSMSHRARAANAARPALTRLLSRGAALCS